MDEEDILALIQKYEEAQSQNKSIYLDADEFEILADYFDDCGDLDQARTVIKEGLHIHPNNANLLFKKSRLVMYEGDYLRALELLTGYTNYDYDLYIIKLECYINLGLIAESSELISELIENEDEDLDQMFSEIGSIFFEADMYEEALVYLNKSLEYKPNNVEIFADIVHSYEMLGDYQSAIDICNKILDVNPYESEAWVNIGKLYSMLEEYGKAIDAFDFAITIVGETEYLLNLKGHSLAQAKRTEEAIEIFRQALELNNLDKNPTYFFLSECYQELGIIEKALEYIELYAQNKGADIDYYAKKAQLLLALNRPNDALAFIQEAIQKEDEDATLEMSVIEAEVFVRMERFIEAEDTLEGWKAENEDNFYLVNMLSIIAIKKEEYDKAISLTEHLLSMDEQNLETKQRLVLLYFEMNKEDAFNDLLEEFTDRELRDIYDLVYSPKSTQILERDEILKYLNDARERRMLFKNMQF